MKNETQTAAARLKAKRPQQVTVWVLLDPGAADRYEAASGVLAEAIEAGTHTQPTELWPLQLAVHAAALDCDLATMPFTFAAIGSTAFDHLLAEHPPELEAFAAAAVQGTEAPAYGETFAPALVAASCTDPGLTLAEAQALFADPSWNRAELAELFGAAVSANTSARPIPARADHLNHQLEG